VAFSRYPVDVVIRWEGAGGGPAKGRRDVRRPRAGCPRAAGSDKANYVAKPASTALQHNSALSEPGKRSAGAVPSIAIVTEQCGKRRDGMGEGVCGPKRDRTLLSP